MQWQDWVASPQGRIWHAALSHHDRLGGALLQLRQPRPLGVEAPHGALVRRAHAALGAREAPEGLQLPLPVRPLPLQPHALRVRALDLPAPLLHLLVQGLDLVEAVLALPLRLGGRHLRLGELLARRAEVLLEAVALVADRLELALEAAAVGV